MPESIRPHTNVVLRLPSDALLIQEVLPHTTISLGKYGSFLTNYIIGRPFHLTFEILDKSDIATRSPLRIVPASELYADIIKDEDSNSSDLANGKTVERHDGVEYEVVGQNGEVVLRTNQNIIDDTGTQSLTMDEIEVMKAESTGSGKDLIAKILESHKALDQKTAFALAKYTLRKAKKYLKRFSVLPLDVSTLTKYILQEKEPMRIMELREEMIALIGSWSNIHYAIPEYTSHVKKLEGKVKAGRWLMIDDTGGILVAAMAERMGLLNDQWTIQDDQVIQPRSQDGEESAQFDEHSEGCRDMHKKSVMPSNVNSITLIHANSQPNLSLLKYFNFDAANPTTSHPLSRHLKTISWLQVIAPEDDTGYVEPVVVSDEILNSWKSGKRGSYYRKRRRWERTKSIVDETRSGEFDGLIVASPMSLKDILHCTIPLLRGAAQVVIYSPTIEPLTELADYYSTTRRTAFVTSSPEDLGVLPSEDFPVNPTLLLAPSVQTIRAKSWQVLPGRTHPHMTGHGGAEGYLFTATRVLPAEGKIEARGNFKRRKTGAGEKGQTPDEAQNEIMDSAG